MNDGTYKNFLIDLCWLIKEKAFSARESLRERRETGDSSDYSHGYMMAYHEIISLVQQQAEAFGIPIEDIGLSNISPEKDLLQP